MEWINKLIKKEKNEREGEGERERKKKEWMKEIKRLIGLLLIVFYRISTPVGNLKPNLVFIYIYIYIISKWTVSWKHYF